MRKLSVSFIVVACISLSLSTKTAYARVQHIKQGGLLTIDIPIPRQTKSLTAEVFDKTWPYHLKANSTMQTWIGIDMETRPAKYQLTIRGKSTDEKNWQKKVEFVVKKTDFPASYIKVKKKMAVFDARALARIKADQIALKKTYSMQVDSDPEIRLVHMPVSGRISTRFGARRFVNGEPRSPHSGIDLAAPSGTPVLAPLSGRVLLAESMFLNGNAVAIGHGNGLVSVYTHLQKLAVQKGQWLKTGDHIGTVGQTGRATGPHLHWGVRYMNARINPLSLFESDK
ncbi:MAG: M23 family metallopeptidase [Mariprofundaceae bacterium]